MRVGLILLLIMISPTLYADNYVYSSLPPNDVSLTYAPSPAPRPIWHRPHRYHSHHRHHRHHTVTTAHRHHHRTFAYRTKKHGPSGLFVYYVLPATACCGPTWPISHVKFGAHSGAWESSPYGTFIPTAEDLQSNGTDDDEFRGWDKYEGLVGEDSLEDPG